MIGGARADVVFNLCNGRWGEMAAVQGVLDGFELPYNTFGRAGLEALAMDKQRSKMCSLRRDARGREWVV